MRRTHLRKKDIRSLEESIQERFGITLELPRKAHVEVVETEKVKLLAIEGEQRFFYGEDNELIPSLKLLLERQFLKEIAIDMPAVSHITNGADVMRPGIVRIDPEIERGELVCVVDETHGKPLAVGRAKLSGKEMQESNSGKVVENLHHIGDDIWNTEI